MIWSAFNGILHRVLRIVDYIYKITYTSLRNKFMSNNINFLADKAKLRFIIGFFVICFLSSEVHASIVVESLSINGINSDQYMVPWTTFSLASRTRIDTSPESNLTASFYIDSQNFTYDNSTSSISSDDLAFSMITPIPKSWTQVGNNIFNPPSDNSIFMAWTTTVWKRYFLKDIKISIPSNFSSPSFWIIWNFTSSAFPNWMAKTRKAYINVRPHIIDYYFSNSSIRNNWTDAVSLTVKVRDFNWCSNIDWLPVVANLSSLWLSTSTLLTYQSCDTDWITATFVKSNIQTTVWIWDIRFWTGSFTFNDEDRNTWEPNDTNFNSIDKNTSITLTVTEAWNPAVTISSVSDSIIWLNETASPDSSITFSWDQNWTYRIVINWDGQCSSWIVWVDWSAYTAWTPITYDINASSLGVWANTVYICVKSATNKIWSSNTVIIRDDTAPTTTFLWLTATVTTWDANFTFSCSEAGTYSVYYWWSGSKNWSVLQTETSIVAWVSTSFTIPNANIPTWTNSYYVYCTDSANNYSYTSWTVTRTDPPPSMAWLSISFVDQDVDYNWVDWRDFTINWTTNSTITSYAYFNAYRIYLLPAWTSLNTASQTPIKYVMDKAQTSVTLLETNKADSAWWTLAWNTAYIAYILVTSATELWQSISSSSNTVTSDTVSNPSLVNAWFTTSSTIMLQFDVDLSSTLTDHSWALITSNWWAFTVNTSTWTSWISWVNGKFIEIYLNPLWNTALTDTILLATWAIRALWGWFNNYQSWTMIDWQGSDITISSFSKSENAYFSWPITISYSFSEEMNSNTALRFQQVWWEPDSVIHNIYSYTNLWTWSHTVTINPADLNWNSTESLVSWATYNFYVAWYDKQWNYSVSASKVNLKYDSRWPNEVVRVPYPNPVDENSNYTSISTPTFTWFSTNDYPNESWVGNYELQVSLLNDFSTIFSDIQVGSWVTTYAIPTSIADWTYYWRVKAIDVVWNSSDWSTIWDFIINSSLASITNIKFNSTTRWLNDISYEPSGNTISVTAEINNSASWCITWDFSNIWGSSSVPVTTYVWTWAVWDSITIGWWVAEWLKLIVISALNSSCVGVTSTWAANLWIDNTAPVIWTWLTAPWTWNYISWSWLTNITWVPSSIQENNFDFYGLEYSLWSTWVLLETWSTNNWSYSWDVPDQDSVTSNIRLTIYDKAWYSTVQTWWTFVLDSTVPTVSGSAITYPNWGENLRGWSGYLITWSAGQVTDTNLSSTWINLYYSLDSGTTWSLISSALANSSAYSWSVPSSNLQTAKIMLEATDLAWNSSFDISDAVFTIDSVQPTITSAVTQDLDSNWHIDAVKLTLSENIVDSSVNVANYSVSNYTISWFSPLTNWDLTNDNIIYLNLTEKVSYDTNVTPLLTYTAWSLADVAWNVLASTSKTISDGAYPVVLSRVTQDTNSDWTQDAVLVTFSENMNSTSVSASSFVLTTSVDAPLTSTYSDTVNDNTLLLWYTWWTPNITNELTKVKLLSGFTDLHWISLSAESAFTSSTDWVKPSFIAETQWTSASMQVIVTFSENVTFTNTWTWSVPWATITSYTWSTNAFTINITWYPDTSFAPIISLSNWIVADSSWNQLNSLSVSSTDWVNPEVSTISTVDSDSDWYVDWAVITFSESVLDSSITPSDYLIWWNNWTAIDTLASADDLQVKITSSQILWTVVQDVTYTAWTTQDLSWNNLATFWTSSFIELDWAGPAILSAFYVQWASVASDEIIVWFSENVLDSSITPSDFTVLLGWFIANATIDSETANDNQIVIKLSASDTRLTVGTSTISFSWVWVVSDGTNTSTQTTSTLVNGSVIINEIAWAGSTISASDQWIELRNLSDISVDISGLMLDNVLPGGYITIPASSSIPANWYYIISRYSASSSILNVTPDYVTTAINLNSTWNWNIKLRNWSIIIDQAKWDVWPAWTWNWLFYSMERNINPWSWLSSLSWHDSVTTYNFDAWSTVKGTPWTWNIADAISPVIDQNSLIPVSDAIIVDYHSPISVSYSDNIWVDTSKVTLYLDLDSNLSTWTSWCETQVTPVVSTISLTYTPTSAWTSWRNRACLVVWDEGWNLTTSNWDFWVDAFTFTVEEVTPIRLDLSPSIDAEAVWATHLRITTYWAWFTLRWNFSNLTFWTVSIWGSNLNYDSSLAKDSVTINPYSGYSTATSATVLQTVSPETDLQSNPALKTYDIYLKYKVSVSAIQTAWAYTWSIAFDIDINY